MITNDGKMHVKRFMAGMNATIAESIAFGIGTKAEAAGDTSLQFETGRSDIVLTSFDFNTNKLIFKAPVPDNMAGTIYEVALFSMASNTEAGMYGSRLVSPFDSDTEEWVDSATGNPETFATANVRVGADGLVHTPAASTTKTSALRDIVLDFSGYSGADMFSFAFNVGNSNTSAVKVRFLTDSGNYYEFSLTGLTAGYQIMTKLKSTATVVGSPDWGNITEIQVSTTSTSGGASSVTFDGIRIDDMDTVNPNYVMVSRKKLATPFVKQDGKTQDIEFALDVNIA